MARFFWKILLAGLAIVAGLEAAPAQSVARGAVTGQPMPRYVSLKSDRVNLREGPSKDHRTAWVFQRAGLPVEIMAEFETWRRVRDAEGTEGWVLHSLLSGRRTALVAPWEKSGTLSLLDRADDRADVLARVQPNVIASIRKCDGSWCRVQVQERRRLHPPGEALGRLPEREDRITPDPERCGRFWGSCEAMIRCERRLRPCGAAARSRRRGRPPSLPGLAAARRRQFRDPGCR